MITPRKSAFLEWGMIQYVSKLAQRRFHRLHIAGAQHVRAARGSVLLVVNHVSWWDGLIFLLSNRGHFGRAVYAAMSEQGLRQYPIFRRVGAFSLPQQTTGASLLHSIRYAHQILREPNTLLLYFPQGEQRHESCRPLRFADGIGAILRTCPPHFPVTVIPAALHYTFLEQARPEVFLRIGEGIADDVWRKWPDDIAQKIASGSDVQPARRPVRALDHAIASRLETQVTQLLDAQLSQIGSWDHGQRLCPPTYHTLWPVAKKGSAPRHLASPAPRANTKSSPKGAQANPSEVSRK